MDHAGAVVATGHEVRNAACRSKDSAFSELEQLVKQKTFSRAEIDRLTELLRSKTVDTPAGNDKSAVASPVTSSRVPKGNVASPAELAKAYMGTRPSKASPSILSSQSQDVRVDTPLLKNVAYSKNLPITSVTTKTAGLVGVRANGFTTPRSRGRSAIYHMARMPYFRLRQTDGQMASSSTYNAYSGSYLSESVLEHDGYFGSKQPLKRRSSVLEDDIESVGAMRRTRQKPNILSHGVSRPSPGAGNDDDHLENLTPKEKSSESRLAAGKDKTPKKLTSNMLRGQALKSLESLDSPKLLQSAQDSHELENWFKVVPTNAHDSSLQKQDKIEQHRQNKSIYGSTVVARNNEKLSSDDAQHAQPGVETADSLDKRSSAQPQKKHVFRMSALEDSFELDEDINSDESASQLAEEGREKMGISGAEKKSLSTDEALNKPAALFEMKATLGILNKRNDMEAPDSAVISVNSTSFLPSSDPEVVPPSFGSNKSKESSGDKVPAPLFSSSFPLSGSRPETSSSLSNPAFGLAGASSELVESDNSQKDGKSNGKLEPLSSLLSPLTLFAAPSSTSSFSNGQFAPSAAISPTSLLASSNSPKDVQSGSSSEVASSTSISAAVGSTTGNSITSGGGLFGSPAASSVSTEPLVKFGTSEAPPVVSTLSTTSSAHNADLKTKATNFGNLSSRMSTVTTASVQSQSSVFSTGAQSLVSAQTSLAGSDSTTGSQSVPAHFGSSTTSPEVGNSVMTSFSSVGSAASNTGLVSAAASGSNPVGSSAAAFGNFSFGPSSSASSTMGSSVGPSSGTTQLAFTFGATPAVSAATTALATSSNATSATFSFGVNSSSSSANAIDTSTRPSPSTFNFGASSTNAINASSTVSPSPFAFGASSASSQTSTAGVFGSNWQAPKSPGFSSVTPTGFAFGASLSSFTAPTTTAVVFGSAPSTPSGPAFSFGSTLTSSSSQPVFGNSSPFIASPGNNNQMNSMEDSMAEDNMQATSPAVAFGQSSVSPSPGGFVFGSTPSPFQFGGQQRQPAAQNSSPFAASCSLGAGGSFSLGSNGPDKSGRKIIKVNRNKCY
ncbi:hypothetical protein K7X08_030240 [Anisodus acutangulus]|uniref:Nuclear pore complex protein NUP1-like n=1 Tax=Anisodus acutangulus TaxID=402998 RepID=A0A9Q1LMD7_9SOLA|nr:hypothetical protein K7X08_030240 [Anisodus acutangulus]